MARIRTSSYDIPAQTGTTYYKLPGSPYTATVQITGTSTVSAFASNIEATSAQIAIGSGISSVTSTTTRGASVPTEYIGVTVAAYTSGTIKLHLCCELD